MTLYWVHKVLEPHSFRSSLGHSWVSYIPLNKSQKLKLVLSCSSEEYEFFLECTIILQGSAPYDLAVLFFELLKDIHSVGLAQEKAQTMVKEYFEHILTKVS